jgi:hypothetical protein
MLGGEFIFNPLGRSRKNADRGLGLSEIQQPVAQAQIKQAALPLINPGALFGGCFRRCLQWVCEIPVADTIHWCRLASQNASSDRCDRLVWNGQWMNPGNSGPANIQRETKRLVTLKVWPGQ